MALEQHQLSPGMRVLNTRTSVTGVVRAKRGKPDEVSVSKSGGVYVDPPTGKAKEWMLSGLVVAQDAAPAGQDAESETASS